MKESLFVQENHDHLKVADGRIYRNKRKVGGKGCRGCIAYTSRVKASTLCKKLGNLCLKPNRDVWRDITKTIPAEIRRRYGR